MLIRLLPFPLIIARYATIYTDKHNDTQQAASLEGQCFAMNEPKLRQVAILIFDDVEVLDFAGPFEVFNVASQMIAPKPLDVFTLAKTDAPIKARGALSIIPHYTFQNCPTPDILLIPGGRGARVLMHDDESLEFIRGHAARLDYLLSVCTGALVLGKAGLLDGLRVTTHHDAFDELREVVPTAKIIEDERYTTNAKIWTSGGISAGIDMALHLLRQLVPPADYTAVVDEMEWMWYK